MSHEANATVVNPLPAPLRGSASVPGDKSISHRAVLFAAMAEGTSRLSGVLDSEDVRSSIRAVGQLGAQVSLEKQPDGSLAGGVTGGAPPAPRSPRLPSTAATPAPRCACSWACWRRGACAWS